MTEIEIDGVKYPAVAVTDIPRDAYLMRANDGQATAVFTSDMDKFLGVMPVMIMDVIDMYEGEQRQNND